MGDVISIGSVRRQKDESEKALWQTYLAARDKAQASDDINDGIIAGKAWANWVRSFEGRAS